MYLMRWDQFHWAQFFSYFFSCYYIFFLSQFILSWFHLKVDKMPFFYFRFVSKSHQKCQEKCRDLQIFLVECVLSGFFMIWDMMGQTIPDSWQRDIEYDHLVWRLILCCGTPISKPLKCLKMAKLWLSSSAKDHIGHKKVRGDWWWCLFCPSWPWN